MQYICWVWLAVFCFGPFFNKESPDVEVLGATSFGDRCLHLGKLRPRSAGRILAETGWFCERETLFGWMDE